MSGGGCYFACCCAVLYLLVQSTSTGELRILWPALLCVCVRLHDFANSVRLVMVHTVLLIRLFLSNTAEFSCVLYLAVCVSCCPASNHTHTDVQAVCIERTNSSVGSVC